VDQPSAEAATSILRGLRPRYERHHGVTISEGALLAATALSSRYISGRHLPDKAIDCLDEAAAQVCARMRVCVYVCVCVHAHACVCESAWCVCGMHTSLCCV
jgi:ATP-dependent Clp protease ATP-binding subunit ClpA